MRIHRVLGTHRRHRVLMATGAAAVMVGALAVPSASAATSLNLLASTTTLTATLSEDGQSIRLAAEVTFENLHKGLGITPSGTVHFTDNVGDDLGTVGFPKCFNVPCVVTERINATRLSDGVESIHAVYSGDLLLKPSTGFAPVGFGLCGAGGGCNAYAEVPNADIEVNADSDTGYVVDSLGGSGLPCGVSGGGPVGNANASGLSSSYKEVYYMLVGAWAEAYNTQISNVDGQNWFCYVSPEEFQAYSQGGGSVDFPDNSSSFAFFGDAPQIGSGPYANEYVGLLPGCDLSDGVAPCIESYSVYQNSDNGNRWEFSSYLKVPPGDPHMGGLKLPALPKLGSSG